MGHPSRGGRSAGAGGPLPDEAIRAIARAIRAAVRLPPPDDWRDDICSAHHELPPADEDRVIAELERGGGAS